MYFLTVRVSRIARSLVGPVLSKPWMHSTILKPAGAVIRAIVDLKLLVDGTTIEPSWTCAGCCGAVHVSGAWDVSSSVSRHLSSLSARHVCDIVATTGRWTRDVCAGGCVVLVEVKLLCLVLVEVLARIGGLVLEHLDEAIETDCQKRAKSRSQPIDPMCAGEDSRNDAWTKRAGWIERAWKRYQLDDHRTGEDEAYRR